MPPELKGAPLQLTLEDAHGARAMSVAVCPEPCSALPAEQCPDGCASGDSNSTALCNEQAKCTACIEGYALTDAGECAAVSVPDTARSNGHSLTVCNLFIVPFSTQHLCALPPVRLLYQPSPCSSHVSPICMSPVDCSVPWTALSATARTPLSGELPGRASAQHPYKHLRLCLLMQLQYAPKQLHGPEYGGGGGSMHSVAAIAHPPLALPPSPATETVPQPRVRVRLWLEWHLRRRLCALH